jgi:hypothetical protein
MKTKYAIAIALALAVMPGGAYAKPHHSAPEDCLVNIDKNGKQYCMTEAEEKSMQDKISADSKAATEASLKNCREGVENKAFLGSWIGPPSEEDCRPFAAQIKNGVETRPNQYAAKLHHAKNEEIMKHCNRMTDTPGIDWTEVAALRGVTVTMDDCVKASAGLAAEFGK